MDKPLRATVFGVGRSGTKAVQIKIAWLLARKYGSVHLQYEPYFHLSRKGPRSYRGMREHRNAPMIIPPSETLSKSHAGFIKNLLPGQNLPTVAKFIHGNGRINQINRLLAPDLSLLVIRDLYQVLNSIVRMNWDFYRFGSGYLPLTSVNFLSNLIASAKRTGMLTGTLASIVEDLKPSDRVMCNAVYWYVMNKAALTFRQEEVIPFNYSEMKELPKLLGERLPQGIFSPEEVSAIPDFAGSMIHQNYPLENSSEVHRAKSKTNLVNESLFLLTQRTLRKFPVPFNRSGGEKLVLADTGQSSSPETSANTRIRINVQQSSLLDDMNSEVFALLSSYS